MIKNIVFDMGNVLISYDSKAVAASYTQNKEEGILLWEEVLHSVEWIQMDRGSIGEEDAMESICKRLPQHLHSKAKKLLQEWHENIPAFPEIEELIRRLKEAGYRIYLLSNTSKRFYQFRRGIPALQYFDGEFISADWKLLKPESEIYLLFFQHFNLSPDECYFIDDTPTNVEAAQRLGMRGYVYHQDVSRLEQALKDEGIRC